MFEMPKTVRVRGKRCLIRSTLPSVEALTQLHGRLSFADSGTQTSRCQTSILECLKIIDNLKGFCILAHVDSPKGFEFEVPGNSSFDIDTLETLDYVCHFV